MAKERFPVSSLKEYHGKQDSNGILSSLLNVKKHLRGAKNVGDIDREACEILVNLIKYPNSKIMDITVSILANCCRKSSHRKMFKELGGIPLLVLIIKTVDNDSILCRSYRLLGNLAYDYSLASVLNEYNVGFILLKSLEKIDNKSPATLMMTFRAVKKLWVVKEFQSKMLPEDVSTSLNNCISSTDDQLVALSVEALTLFSTVKRSQSKFHIKVSKELLAKLVELYKKKNMSSIIINCLSNLICYQTTQTWKHLEGSKLPETFIDYIQYVDQIHKVVLEAFYKLCTEGGVRSKVKASGLLQRLLKLCYGSNTQRILSIFYLFEFDVSSIAILAQDKSFITLLIQNVPKNGAVRLLSVVSRLDPPVKELLSSENLSVIIKHKECHGILRKIAQTKKFLSQLIASGRIWEIAKVNCLSEDRDQYTEALIVHLLQTGDQNEIENAALAAPFLVKPRHFTLYNMLAHNDGITIILRLLKERTLEERILATVVKLISIFQENFYNNYKNCRGFFDDYVRTQRNENHSYRNEMPEDVTMDEVGTAMSEQNSNSSSAPEMVIFELDCGTLITVNKTLLCKYSPMLDAMLNGNFMESSQQKVKLSCCSPEALTYLEKLLMNKARISDINIENHLELISLTDRFLITNLHDTLTASLTMDQSSCVAVLQWCRTSGYTKNSGIIKKKAYEFIFSSSSNLLLAMENEGLRAPLVNEISTYLSNSFLDLL